MNIVLNNQSGYGTVASTEQGDGWCVELQTFIPVGINQPDTSIVIVGDKPGVTENIITGLKTVVQAATVWIHRPQKKEYADTGEQLIVSIGNNGPNPVRVILVDGTTDCEVPPGVTYQAHAVGYIEIRELGLANVDETEAP